MKYTEDQLKAALVRALPEHLSNDTYTALNDEQIYCWSGMGYATVTPREWPAIVGMVEDELTDKQTWQVEDWIVENSDAHRAPLTAKWTIRSTALADIGAITVDEQK
jgi:hypothetical protein